MVRDHYTRFAVSRAKFHALALHQTVRVLDFAYVHKHKFILAIRLNFSESSLGIPPAHDSRGEWLWSAFTFGRGCGRTPCDVLGFQATSLVFRWAVLHLGPCEQAISITNSGRVTKNVDAVRTSDESEAFIMPPHLRSASDPGTDHESHLVSHSFMVHEHCRGQRLPFGDWRWDSLWPPLDTLEGVRVDLFINFLIECVSESYPQWSQGHECEGSGVGSAGITVGWENTFRKFNFNVII